MAPTIKTSSPRKRQAKPRCFAYSKISWHGACGILISGCGAAALAPPRMPRPKLFLVGGPSGAGKDALLAGAREKAADVAFVIRDVTRAADQCSALERSVSSDEFATGEYALRWSAHGTTDYGIPSKALEEALPHLLLARAQSGHRTRRHGCHPHWGA